MKATNLTTQSFNQQVLQADKPVLVDFWATWCGPCRMIGPVLDELAAETEGRATVAKVNVDEEPALAVQYGVEAIPTLLVFKNGQVTGRFQGVTSKSRLAAALSN